MRLFVGIDIDEAIRESLVRYVARLQCRVPEVRFVSARNYHVTLKFLGETTKVDEVREALRKVKISQFEIALRGTGFFPTERAPRIFWAGIHAGDELRELATAVSWMLADLGFEAEASFKPHLTLARSGSGRPKPKPGDKVEPLLKRVHEVITAEPEAEFGTMTAREFCLFESKLLPTGAQYSKVERYELAAR